MADDAAKVVSPLVKELLVARSILMLVVFNALFVQLIRIVLATTANVAPVGASGATAKHMGLIMSFSSCPSRWQWSTYSQPKFVGRLMTVTGLPMGLTLVKFIVPPWGCVGSSSLTLFGILNG